MKRKYSDIDDEEDDYGESKIDSIKKNHIYFNGEVNQDSINELIEQINEVTFDIIQTKFQYDIEEIPIYLHIDSTGGCLHSGLKGFDYIRKNPVKIVTIAEGFVASAATFLLIAGSQRQGTQNTQYLIHHLKHSHSGKMGDLRDNYKNCRDISQRVLDLYLSNTKMTKDVLESRLKKEREFDSKKALEFGLIDSII